MSIGIENQFKNLVSTLTRLKLATNEKNIEQLSNLVSSMYKSIQQEIQNSPTDIETLRRLRPIIIEIYNKKQAEIKTYHSIQQEIKLDQQQYDVEINTLFKQIDSEQQKNKVISIKKKYSIEDLTNQIDEIFTSGTLLTPDGTINQITQRLLLERIYVLSKEDNINPEAIKLLIDRVTKPKEKTISIKKISESKIVNNVDISPAISGVCSEDKERLTHGINQLCQS